MNASTTVTTRLLHNSKLRSASARLCHVAFLFLTNAVCWGIASAQMPGCRLDSDPSVQVVAGLAENCRMQWNPGATASPALAVANPGTSRQRATQFPLVAPGDITLDEGGNLYISDSAAARILKVDATTGFITTVAGNGTAGYAGDGGPATAAELNQPAGIAVDHAGNLFVADTLNFRIRKVTQSTGRITTVAGNGLPGYMPKPEEGAKAVAGAVNYPESVAVDAAGDVFYTEMDADGVRRVDARTGISHTVAGGGSYTPEQVKRGEIGDGGPAQKAFLHRVDSIAVDTSGNLYIVCGDLFSDQPNLVREVDAKTGIIRVIAGVVNKSGSSGKRRGRATELPLPSFGSPGSLTVDALANVYFLTSDGTARVDHETGMISYTSTPNPEGSSNGGPAWNQLAVDNEGNMYLAAGSHVVRYKKP